MEEQQNNKTMDLRARILPARNPLMADRHDYEQAYKLWYDVWSSVWKEQAGIETFTSDDFYKQDFVYAIYLGSNCVALTLGTIVDLSLPVSHSLYYMSKVWTKDTHSAMLEYGNQIFLSTHITTHPDWRGRGSSISLKDVVVLFALKCYEHSKADLLIGAMRNNRNVHTLAYKYGAKFIKTVFQKEIQLEVDLIFSTKESIKNAFNDTWGDGVVKLWKNCPDAKKYLSLNQQYQQQEKKSA